jgi:hypothetical protein
MLALTLDQPWASLLFGGKTYETRGWCRGITPGMILAVHAAKEWRGSNRQLIGTHPAFTAGLAALGFTADYQIPRGAVLGTIRIDAIYRVAGGVLRDITTGQTIPIPPPPAVYYGDFADGRYAWARTVLDYFRTPVPAKGKQGLWHWMTAEEQAAAPPPPVPRQLSLF